ncbi:hairy-related 5 [Nerophis ophidion]|uniref:hairy-related 5 n=1 Tax=Nerophis ophidion TaxID=159077 RepID=UPI002AE02EF1|nr:hairy-related 5 [Nerophis ophidion]
MKPLTAPETSRQRVRRVTKPVMEKRRRERINHNLETLRLLMLDTTQDEKLKNPKVEKAEILESVVQFLKENRAVTSLSGGQKTTGPGQQHRDYRAGMRSCLRTIKHFMAAEDRNAAGRNSVGPPEAQMIASSSGHVPHTFYPQHPQQGGTSSLRYLPQGGDNQCDTRKLSSPSACVQSQDPVWRPWLAYTSQ